jgi:ABC-type antimicrobial peptide transport system permease subunit
VVGVVADAVYLSLRDGMQPTMYLPLAQWDWGGNPPNPPPTEFSISVRSSTLGSPMRLARSVAAALTDANRDLDFSFRPLGDLVDASLTQERLVAMLSGFFGALALLLAAFGIYGVTSYAVNRRRAEIGIRRALGATPGAVVRLVLSRVFVLVALGVVVGGTASVWASRFVAALLFGLEPRDPGTLIGSIVVLAAVGALAGWLPARRAARFDPMVALRHE